MEGREERPLTMELRVIINHLSRFAYDATIVHRARLQALDLVDKIDEELKANAQLIAAAPDMYEALRSFVSMQDRFDILGALRRGGLDDIVLNLIDNSRKALAKAEGEEI